MGNHNIYLPKEMSEEIRKLEINLSALVQKAVAEYLELEKCPTCKQPMPK